MGTIDILHSSAAPLIDLSAPSYPDSEARRIQVLRQYEILDRIPNESLDRITAIAARLFNIPIAIISLVDTSRICLKSHYGLPFDEIERRPGLCSTAILAQDTYVINDTLEDALAKHHPLVTGEMGIRFYAASPLKTRDGYCLGMLCVLDRVPRTMSPEEEKMLADLATLAMDEIERHRTSIKAAQLQKELLGIAAHDLRSPLNGILGLSEMIPLQPDPDILTDMCSLVKNSSQKMLRAIDRLLDSALLEEETIRLQLDNTDLSSMVEMAAHRNQLSANKKGQYLLVGVEGKPTARIDSKRIGEALDNLISNAIKYSPKNTTIEVRTWANEGKVYVSVKDQGQGLSNNDKKKLFARFSRLSATMVEDECAPGLGLSIVKMLVELHNGQVWAESEGKGKGSTFTVELPAI